MEGQFYALFYAILYEVFEHPQMLVSWEGPGTNPTWILEMIVVKCLGCQKL